MPTHSEIPRPRPDVSPGLPSAGGVVGAEAFGVALEGVRNGLGVAEGVFLLTWGGASLLTAWGIALAGHVRGAGVPGWWWAMIPTVGLAGTVLARWRWRFRAFYPLHGQVGMLWGVVGPCIGGLRILVENPLPVQLLLVGCGLVAHGALLRWRALWGCGLAATAGSFGLVWIPGVWQVVAFGAAVGVAMCPLGAWLCAQRRMPA